MMKLIIFVLFSGFVFVQSKITAKNKTLLIKAGDPFTLECDDPSAKWKLNVKIIANCENCHSSTCNIDDAYKNRITAFCKQEYSVLHFNSTQIGDKGSLLCPKSGSTDFQLLVGNYNIRHFHSENKFPFAFNQKSYTMVCDKEQTGDMIWYYETNNMLSYFGKDCSELISEYDKNMFHFTCDAKQKKGTFHIKQVSLSQDGNIIGCESAGQLYLFRLTVNVPVTSVSIQLQSQDLLENKDGIFVCKVEESKPEASFQWIIIYQNGSSQEIQQKSSISKTAKGKLWQTSSTLILKLKRDYKKIMCKARIENMRWTNSEYQLDIKYPPEIKIHHKVTSLNKQAEISCTAEARPNNIQYKIIQKWGNKEKRIITKKKKSFTNFSYYDLGKWICQASNGVPNKGYYTHTSVEIKVNVAAHFQGNKNESGIIGSEKLLKICFYCNPAATDVKWYKGNEEMPFDRISYIPAEDGLFPFLGNCSILKLVIQKKEIQKYSLKVINSVGERTFELTLATVIPSNSSTEPLIYIIVSSVISVIVIIIIGGIVYFLFRRSKKTQSNNNPINNLRMSNGQENGNEPQYIDLTSRSPVTGERYRKELQYIDITNKQPIKGKINGNEPVYMNAANRSPVKGHLDYEDLEN